MPISDHNKVIANQSIMTHISPTKSIESNEAPT